METAASLAGSGANIPRHQYVPEVGETGRDDNSAGGSALLDDFEWRKSGEFGENVNSDQEYTGVTNRRNDYLEFVKRYKTNTIW